MRLEKEDPLRGKWQSAKRIAPTVVVLFVAFLAVLGFGRLCAHLSDMTSFQGCIVFLGSAALVVLVWAVHFLARSAVGLGREIRASVEGLETFWGDPEMDGEDQWQEWSAPEMGRRPLSRDRVGEPLCPCGSGKPYTQCCGREN